MTKLHREVSAQYSRTSDFPIPDSSSHGHVIPWNLEDLSHFWECASVFSDEGMNSRNTCCESTAERSNGFEDGTVTQTLCQAEVVPLTGRIPYFAVSAPHSDSCDEKPEKSCLGLKDFRMMIKLPSRRNSFAKPGLEGSLRAKYHWALIKQFIGFSFAIRGFKRKPWVQLAGHKDSFQTGEIGTVLKKLCPEEHHCLKELMNDASRPFVPLYSGTVEIDGQEFIVMRDLLTGFDPEVSVMDCKLGIRTYLEDELTKARENPKMRPDMYQKMVELDRNAPTPEENMKKAVTKPRYMQWRETLSSSATLGFRVEGIKKADGFSSKDFKFVKSKCDVLSTLKIFTDFNAQAVQLYILRLKDLRKAVMNSTFFSTHEVIGTSLLMIHDKNGLVGVWMIDFAKTVPLPGNIVVDHVRPWVEGNHEDGYLFGLNNLIICFEELLYEINQSSS